MLFNNEKKQQEELDQFTIEINKAKSLLKEVQDKVDSAMAEEVRLKTSAKSIEDLNKKAIADYEVLMKSHQVSIESIAIESATVAENLAKIREMYFSEQEKRDGLKSEVAELFKKLIQLDEDLNNKKSLITATESLLLKRTEELNNFIAIKEKEITILGEDVIAKRQSYLKELTNTENILLKKNKEVEELTNKQDLLNKEIAEADKSLHEIKSKASDYEHKTSVALDEFNRLTFECSRIKEDITIKENAIHSINQEIAVAKEELKKINIERINSKNFMDELSNKEANLKRRYEDVGLEYN